jgi:hypothetical protein
MEIGEACPTEGHWQTLSALLKLDDATLENENP